MPTDSRELRVLEKLKTTIAGINGSPTYHYDLSATNQVVIGEVQEIPDLYPCAFIQWVREQVKPGLRLNYFTTVMTVAIVLVVTYADDTPHSRTKAALNAALDVRVAVEGNRTLATSGTDLVFDLVVRSMDDITGDDEAFAGFAMVQVLVELFWEREAAG